MPLTSDSPRSITASKTLSVAAVVAASGTGFTGADGETITLKGSAFGAVTNPRPSAYDDFTSYNSLSEGTLLPEGEEEGARWKENGSTFNSPYEVDSAVTLGARQVSGKSRGNKSYLSGLKGNPSGPSRETDTGYITFYFQFNESLTTNQPKPIENYSLKLIRYWDNASQNGTRLTFETRKISCTPDDTNGNVLCPITPFATINDNPDCTFDRYAYPDKTQFAVANTWHRAELCIYGPESGDAFLNGQRVVTSSGARFPFYKSPNALAETFYPEIIGCDLSSSSDTTTTLRQWVSEVYEGATPARVEFSNSSSFDPDVTQERYYQLTTSRTETEIQVSAFYGDLNQDDPIYAHVIKSDGSVVEAGQIN